MSALKRAWNLATWTVTVYTIYKQLQTLSEIKEELYSSLSPEQKEAFNRLYGAPIKYVSDLTQIKAGT